ncbi:hypothetical protein [Glycomyces endophyticus]|uniref:hypothetical protein n=1 Tax=Glycomyces endophyticus TaxID=480996 RepID=UPI0031DD2804
MNASYVSGAKDASPACAMNSSRAADSATSATPARTAARTPTTSAATHRRGATTTATTRSANAIHGSQVAAHRSCPVRSCNSGTCSESRSTYWASTAGMSEAYAKSFSARRFLTTSTTLPRSSVSVVPSAVSDPAFSPSSADTSEECASVTAASHTVTNCGLATNSFTSVSMYARRVSAAEATRSRMYAGGFSTPTQPAARLAMASTSRDSSIFAVIICATAAWTCSSSAIGCVRSTNWSVVRSSRRA